MSCAPMAASSSGPSLGVVARKLRRLLGTNVRVRQTAKKGKIEIDFTDEEELERIVRLLTEGGVEPTSGGVYS